MSRSGRQAQLAHSRAYAGGMAAARSPKLKWPLRKIVGDTTVEIIPGHSARRDLLECGHTVRPASDMIGETYPSRRRCRDCFREAEAAAAKTGNEQSPDA